MKSLNLYVGGYTVTSDSGVEVFLCEKHAKDKDRKAGTYARNMRGFCAECFFEDQQNVPVRNIVSQNS